MSNDSIGRYDGYSDRFNFQTTKLKDPEEVLKSMTVGSKDTISTSQEKIDAEVINRLQVNAGGLEHQKLPVVARAGKFIFMAVAVPTYMAAYAIPKWIATHLIPNTCQMIGKGIKQCFKPMEELVMLFMRQFQRILNIFKRERFQVSKALAHFKGFMAMLRQPFTKMKQLWQMMQQKVKERKNALQDLVGELKKLAKEKIKAAGQYAKRTATRFVYGRLNKEEPLAPWREKILSIVRTVYKAYVYTKALPKRTVDAVKQFVVDNYMTYLFPHVDFVRTKVTNAYKKTTQYIQTKTQAVANFCRRIIQKQVELVKKAIEATKQTIIQASVTIYHALGLPKLVNAAVQVWQSGVDLYQGIKGKVKVVTDYVRSKVNLLKSKANSAVAKAKSTLSNAMAASKQFLYTTMINPLVSAYHRVLKKPRTLITSAKSGLKKLSKSLFQRIVPTKKTKDSLKKPALTFQKWKSKAGRKARRAVYYSRLTLSWTKILSGFWMVAVRNTCQSTIDHFTWRDMVYFVKNIGKILGAALQKLAEKSKRRYLKTVKSQ